MFLRRALAFRRLPSRFLLRARIHSNVRHLSWQGGFTRAVQVQSPRLFHQASAPPDSLADAVVEGVDTIKDDEMPFVNRHQELWQVFRFNAMVQRKIIESHSDIKNFRVLKLLFCVQYFGRGKTTLGEVFPTQLQRQDVREFIEAKLELKQSEDIKAEWDLLQVHGIQRVFIDVRTASDIVRKAAAMVTGKDGIKVRDAEQAARHLVEYAQEHGPTLFHFDEVGSDEQHDLKKLRQLAVAVWTRMWEIKRDQGPAEMPRIYFLATGKSTEPFEGVGLGSNDSPCGSSFLILDSLTPKHIGQVRRHLQNKSKVSVPLVLPDLQAKDSDHLDTCLARATGGAPRLLLYTLRALHHLQAPLGSPEEIETAVFETVYAGLRKIHDVASEFFPGRDKKAHIVFAYLLAFYLCEARLQVDTTVRIGDQSTQLAQMLRFQPFFLSRDGRDGSDFTLDLPLFHLKAAEELFGSQAVPLMLISMAGVPLRVNEPWRIFELLPAHIIAVKAALDSALGRTVATWAEVLPALFSNSDVAKTINFNLGPKPFLIHTVTDKLPDAIEDNAEKFAQLGGGVVGKDKSSSEDLLYVQRLKDGKGHGVVGWQPKLLIDTALTMATVRDEVAKGVKQLPALLVLFAATVGPELLDAIAATEERVLVLPSWDKTQAAEFAFGSATGVREEKEEAKRTSLLLWRPRKGGKQNAKWCVFPEQTAPQPANSEFAGRALVVVRPGLDVVIPHHDVVKELVGPTTFDALTAAAGGSQVDTVSAVVTGLDEALSGARRVPPAELKQKPADQFASLPDSNTMEEVLRLVAKAEGYTEEQLKSSRIKLEQSLIFTVHNLRVLSQERIEGLGLPPVVTEFLLRVKG